jgi:hypothetical protein
MGRLIGVCQSERTVGRAVRLILACVSETWRCLPQVAYFQRRFPFCVSFLYWLLATLRALGRRPRQELLTDPLRCGSHRARDVTDPAPLLAPIRRHPRVRPRCVCDIVGTQTIPCSLGRLPIHRERDPLPLHHLHVVASHDAFVACHHQVHLTRMAASCLSLAGKILQCSADQLRLVQRLKIRARCSSRSKATSRLACYHFPPNPSTAGRQNRRSRLR